MRIPLCTCSLFNFDEVKRGKTAKEIKIPQGSFLEDVADFEVTTPLWLKRVVLFYSMPTPLPPPQIPLRVNSSPIPVDIVDCFKNVSSVLTLLLVA
ncbi:hypothetical protein CDAR_601281 [Caerostris darwini]|uniref:Uncharacterized protein n=1 Tax=Caerostris darwini TaxID=1538125 RepID=A0AAV4WWM7_9ARAC|nr:hypothetical protein CDAR_601281 [Caerostris darwini]